MSKGPKPRRRGNQDPRFFQTNNSIASQRGGVKVTPQRNVQALLPVFWRVEEVEAEEQVGLVRSLTKTFVKELSPGGSRLQIGLAVQFKGYERAPVVLFHVENSDREYNIEDPCFLCQVEKTRSFLTTAFEENKEYQEWKYLVIQIDGEKTIYTTANWKARIESAGAEVEEAAIIESQKSCFGCC